MRYSLDGEEQALIKHNKDKEHKKKKSKSAVNCNGSSNILVTGCSKQNENFTFLNDVSMGNLDSNILVYFTNIVITFRCGKLNLL